MAGPDGNLKLRLRALAPEPAKRVLRLLRLVSSDPSRAAPETPQDSINACQFLSSRDAMLDRIPKGGLIAELGVFRGDFAREILSRARPSALHLIDVDLGMLAADIKESDIVKLHQGLTYDIIPGFADNSFDFIYVDADHSYEAVRLDIRNSIPKLKPGGIIAFNDFARIDWRGRALLGVHQAVSEFISEERWQVVYFCFHGVALYDIALRKPAAPARDRANGYDDSGHQAGVPYLRRHSFLRNLSAWFGLKN